MRTDPAEMLYDWTAKWVVEHKSTRTVEDVRAWLTEYISHEEAREVWKRQVETVTKDATDQWDVVARAGSELVEIGEARERQLRGA